MAETLSVQLLISPEYQHTMLTPDCGRDLLWGWALPPCCKACTLTPHPFIYGHLGCSQGVGRPKCGGIDIKV